LTFVGFYIKLSGKIKIAHGKKKNFGFKGIGISGGLDISQLNKKEK
jgi:hypothetical protein